jgi:hypothetical protein
LLGLPQMLGRPAQKGSISSRRVALYPEESD